jgi:hypothetical protein
LQLKTFSCFRGTGWDAPLPREMASESTSVLAFAGSPFAENRAVFSGPAEAFPRSRIMGGSTAGEIPTFSEHG